MVDGTKRLDFGWLLIADERSLRIPLSNPPARLVLHSTLHFPFSFPYSTNFLSSNMPSKTPPAGKPIHFLGLELSTEQLRAVVVDEQLDLVAVEAVDFDTDLSEYQ